MMSPVVRRLGAECDCHRHLSHHGRAAAADQAAISEQHAATRAGGLERRIHAGSAGTDHQHISFGPHRLVQHECLVAMDPANPISLLLV